MNTRTTIAIAAVVTALAALPTSAHAQFVGASVGGVAFVYAPGCQVVRQQFEASVTCWSVLRARHHSASKPFPAALMASSESVASLF